MKETTRMRATCGNWRVWAVRAAGVAAATLAVCGPAQAFYWYDWPGSRIRVQETLIPPTQQNTPGNPPVVTQPPPGPGRIPPPPVGPPVPIDMPPVGPNPTPEPSTGLIGLIGLSAVAAVRRWRAKR